MPKIPSQGASLGAKKKRELRRIRVFLIKFGDPRRTRTFDPMVKSHLLYRLSYRTTFQIEVFCQPQTELMILHIESAVGKRRCERFLSSF